MKTLNVIGNGFDIHHKIGSSYWAYMDWLKGADPDLYDNIVSVYYGNNFDEDLIPCYASMDVDDPEQEDIDEWWGRFEANLGQIDIREFAEYVRQNADEPDFGGDFHDSYWTDAAVQAGDRLLEINHKMKRSFIEWVKQLPDGEIDGNMVFGKEDYFLSFNYTDTLQKLYGVPTTKICYIHGRAAADDDLVLGHNKSEEAFNIELQNQRRIYEQNVERKVRERASRVNTEDIDESEVYDWIREQIEAEEFEDIVYFNIEGALVEEILKLKKHPSTNIKKHYQFFMNIKDARNLKFFWHSFESVDHDYFDYLLTLLDNLESVTVYYYSDKDREQAQDYFSKKGSKLKIDYIKG